MSYFRRIRRRLFCWWRNLFFMDRDDRQRQRLYRMGEKSEDAAERLAAAAKQWGLEVDAVTATLRDSGLENPRSREVLTTLPRGSGGV